MKSLQLCWICFSKGLKGKTELANRIWNKTKFDKATKRKCQGCGLVGCYVREIEIPEKENVDELQEDTTKEA